MEASDRPVRVLVVEDDQEIAQVLQRALRLEGYDVKLAGDGVQALDEVHAFLPDIIVLDLGLPRMDGIDVARRLRKDEDDTPILMLTAKANVEDRVTGLEAGADDYLTKPFAFQELVARVRALARRQPALVDSKCAVADLVIDLSSRRVERGGQPITLTAKEWDLLEVLVRNQDSVLSRTAITERVWDENHDPFTNVLEVLVRRLRRKIDDGRRTHAADRRPAHPRDLGGHPRQDRRQRALRSGTG